MTKPLNIGMIGYGFMGRAHSQRLLARSTTSSTCEYKPVLKAVCARDEAKAKAFAEQWGYESVETDWQKLLERKDIDAVDICTPNNLHHEIAIAAAAGRQDDPLRKAAGDERGRRRGDVRGRREGRRAEHRLVQLPPRARPSRSPSSSSTKASSAASSTTAPSSCRTGRSRADLPQGGAGLWRLDAAAAGSGVTGDLLAHCIDTALWLNGGIDNVTRHDRDVHQGAQAQPDGQGREGRHRRRLRVPVPLRQRLARPRSNRPATPAATRRCTRSRSTASTPRIKWDLHDLHRLQYFDHRDEGTLRGWRSIHVTDGDHPYMGKWWVPGLQIGYEHSFVHQVADFLEGLANGKPAEPDVPRRARNAKGLRRRARRAPRAAKWIGSAVERERFAPLHESPHELFAHGRPSSTIRISWPARRCPIG